MANEQDESRESGSNGLKARAGEKVREIGVVAKERAEERVREISDKARGHAHEQLENQRERMASRIDDAATNLLQHAEHGNRLQQEAELRMAHGMEAAAGYLHGRQTSEVVGDIGGFVRRHPLRALIMAMVAGYLLGRLAH